MFDFKNISIRKKLIIIQLTTAFLAVLVCCVFFVVNDIKVFQKAAVDNKASTAGIIGLNAASALEFNDADAAKNMLLKLKGTPTILNAVIFDKDGKEFARYDKDGEEKFVFPKPVRRTPEQDVGTGQKYIVSSPIFEKDFVGTVMLRAQISGLTEIVLSYIKIAAIILIIGLAAALVISTWLQRYITKRVTSLVDKSTEVAQKGNYSLRATVEGEDEIAVLSGSFNNMLDQIEKMQTSLKKVNVELEERVKSRTVQLESANKELQAKSEELIRSNNELGQFAYVASHDLQEPLRTITNYVGLLKEKYGDQTDEDTILFMRYILNATGTMRNLISHLLEYSRIGNNISFNAVNCNDLVQSLKDEMQQSIVQSGAVVENNLLPSIVANNISLKQLIQNLISNALKFQKKGARPHIEISANEKQDEWLFSIKDNGIGMEKKNQDKIFVIFQRLHNSSEYPGTGIGLATCKKIVSIHKGRIWVESVPGEGSTFFFTISKHLN